MEVSGFGLLGLEGVGRGFGGAGEVRVEASCFS